MDPLLKQLTEALQNLMGLMDSPVGRRKFGTNDFFNESIKIARDTLASAYQQYPELKVK